MKESVLSFEEKRTQSRFTYFKLPASTITILKLTL